jgi:hypothetical protein
MTTASREFQRTATIATVLQHVGSEPQQRWMRAALGEAQHLGIGTHRKRPVTLKLQPRDGETNGVLVLNTSPEQGSTNAVVLLLA